jgi:hypothetical protein
MPSSLLSMPIINNSVPLNYLHPYGVFEGGGRQGKGGQKLSKRFENLGIPVGFLSNNRKNKPRKLPDAESEPIITDKLMNYFISRALP